MKRIVVLDGYTLNPGDISWEPFEQLGKVTVYGHTPAELIAQRCKGARAVISNKTVLDRGAIEGLEGVEYIGLLSTGYNVVDLEAAEKCGITVTNVPAYSSAAVAQHTFALLFALTNHVELHSAAVHDGRWSDPRYFCFWEAPLIELAGKTMGIVGFGDIGRRVAAIAKALGMRVVANSRTPFTAEGIPCLPLPELFACSDVVSFHCPLTEQTAGLCNKRSLGMMKKTAFVLNTSRGGVVVEQDLADALNQGAISGAALDVMEKEPPIGSPLLTAKNCIITPHIAWAATQTRERLMHEAAQNLSAFFQGQRRNCLTRRGEER